MIHQIGVRADNLQRTSLAPVALKSLGGLRVLSPALKVVSSRERGSLGKLGPVR